MGEEVFYTQSKKILIKVDSLTGRILAYNNNKEVGCFEYEVFSESYDHYELVSMNIDEEYQKLGIGTRMIELGEKSFENVLYPSHSASKDENHLTNAGWALIQSCINTGIIDGNKYYDIED